MPPGRWRWRSPVGIVVLLLAAQGAGLPTRADGIELSGTVEMGLAGQSGNGAATDPRLRLLTDLELQLRLSTTTDSGLTLALEYDLDDLAETGTDTRPAPLFPPRGD